MASPLTPPCKHRPLQCPRCGGPMRILRHIWQDAEPPVVLPAREPPQGEFEFDQSAGQQECVVVDQKAGLTGED